MSRAPGWGRPHAAVGGGAVRTSARGCSPVASGKWIADQSAHRLEVRRVGASDPLEQDRLDGRRDGAGLLEAAAGDVVVAAIARRQGVDRQVYLVARGEQFMCGLADAGVRF